MMNSFHKSIIYSVFGSLAAVGLLVSVTACKDDFDYRNNVGQPIAFTLSAPDAWHDGMSVNENAPTTRCTSVKALSGGETKLYLHTVVADNPAEEKGAVTRGTPVRTFEKFKDIYKTFSLSGICYTGEYPKDESQNKWTANFAYNLLCNTDDGTPENTLLWPSNGNVRFFAFAPTKNDFDKQGTGGSLTLSEASHEGSPTLTYTVPTDVTKQIDLMTACATATGPTTPEVVLKFSHALTAVQIKCGKDMLAGKITEVSISGVYGSGTHVIGSGEWTPSGDPSAGYTISEEIDLPSKEDSEDKYHAAEDTQITGKEGDNLTFMLLPQELQDGAKITIKFTDSATDTERTLSGSIAGQEWEAGKIVTYTLSQSSIHITPKIEFSKKPATAENPTGDVMPYSGVWYDATYKAQVEVTQENVETKTIDIPAENVKFQYSIFEDGAWVDCGKDDKDPGLLTIAPQAAYSTMSIGFKDGVAGSEESPSDLSKEYGETANCYLVDQAGYYSLPLVYGNGYLTLPTGNTDGFNYFPKHDDKAISKGEIDGVEDAVLCWQDAPDLIDPASVKVVNGKLVFHIRKQTLAQGNALLAVRDGSSPKKILWSWHIWVTPHKDDFYAKFYTSTPKEGKYSYALAKYNLGWCDKHDHNPSRKFSLKVSATVDMSAYGGATNTTVENEIGEFIQDEFKGSDAGDNTYYQWGRKDPMLGGIYNNDTKKYQYLKKGTSTDKNEFTMENKQVFNQYNKDGHNYSFCKNPGDMIDSNDEASKGVTIGYAIQHPYMFITNSSEYDKNIGYNPSTGEGFNFRNHWHIPYVIKKVDYLNAGTHIMFNAWNAGATNPGYMYRTSFISNEDSLKYNASPVMKSVYDPCPPKFKVPPIHALHGILQAMTSSTPSYSDNAWTITDKGGSITFPMTGVRNYALRPNEWKTVVPLNSTSSPDETFYKPFYKISMPAFRMLTFISSATIVEKEVYNAYQVYIFVIDRNTREDSPGTTNLKKYLTPSSNSYGLAVRPMHYDNNTPKN